MLGKNSTLLPTREIPTPFGSINAPEIRFPPKKGLPDLSGNRRKALAHVVGSDLAGALGVIPYMGYFLAGQIADLHYAEVRKLLTPQELENYIEADKRIPSNAGAMLYSLVREK